MNFIKNEFKDAPIVSYSILLKCVKELYGKMHTIDKTSPRILTTFHRALKSLHANNIINIITDENNKRIIDVLLL